MLLIAQYTVLNKNYTISEQFLEKNINFSLE